MGWRGSARHWHRYQSAYLLLAGLATPLVLSVHTVVSFDFAVAIVPGWHTTIFPPYFVAGAIYSGFAMVLTIAIPLRKAYGLEDFITMRHLDNMAKVMLATGLIVAYGYFFEFFMSMYSGNKFDVFLVQQRLHGPYAPFYYALILVQHPYAAVALDLTNCATTSRSSSSCPSSSISACGWSDSSSWSSALTRDFVPSAWGRYSPHLLGLGHLRRHARYVCDCYSSCSSACLPAISIAEMRELVAETTEEKQ